MITAKEAREFTNSKSNEELKLIDKAIRIVIANGDKGLHLSTGLTNEAQIKQNVLYPKFNGKLEHNTIEVLKQLGYEVETDSSYQGSSVTIMW